MKKLLHLLLVAFVGLSSCTKSDEPPPAAPLQGKWEYVNEREVITSPTGAVVSDKSTTYRAGTHFLEFTDLRLFYYVYSVLTDSGNYTRTGNTLTTDVGDPLQITELTTSRLVLTTTGASGANTSTRTLTHRR